MSCGVNPRSPDGKVGINNLARGKFDNLGLFPIASRDAEKAVRPDEGKAVLALSS